MFRKAVFLLILIASSAASLSAQETGSISPENIARMEKIHEIGSDDSDFFSDAVWTDSNQLIVASVYEGFHIFDLNALDAPTTLGDLSYLSLALSPDSSQIAALNIMGDRAILQIWDLTTESQVHEFLSTNANIEGFFRADFDTNGDLILYGTGGETSENIILWHPLTDSPLVTVNYPYEGSALTTIVANIHLSPDSQTIAASGGIDGLVRQWDTVSGEELTSLEMPSLDSPLSRHLMRLEYSPDGRLLAAGSASSLVVVWNLESGESILTLDLAGVQATGIYFNPAMDIIATKGRYGAQFWSLETGENLFSIEQLDISDIAFSPDGQYVAIVAADTVSIWGIGT